MHDKICVVKEQFIFDLINPNNNNNLTHPWSIHAISFFHHGWQIGEAAEQMVAEIPYMTRS